MKLLFNTSSIITVKAGENLFKTGSEMSQIGEVKNGAMLFDETIEFVGPEAEVREYIKNKNIDLVEEIDAAGRCVLPGFVDSHTHIVFAGNRTEEFGRRLRGVSYKEIAEEGGGIQTTVKATQNASIEELMSVGRGLARNAIKHGTTAMEVKSGYSLTTEGELKQLRAIRELNKELPIDLVPTFLGAHDFPKEMKDDHGRYIDLIVNEMIPQVAEEGLAEYCDAFIDEGYYTVDEGRRVLEAGLENGMMLKVHCDELADVSAAQLAASMGAVSADHLLFASDKSIEALVESETVCGLLPGVAYFIRMPYAPARKMIERGAIVAVASDCNPGSSFTENMQQIMQLAAINMHMTAEETIVAATLNAAHAIERSDIMGSLEEGKQANFIILDSPNYTDLFYHFGINHVEQTFVKGRRISCDS